MIYLDNNATTLIDPEVFETILPLMRDFVGNPSSIHRCGQKAKELLIEATKQCASFFGVRTDEIIFTSGATEALNLLIRSLPKGAHVITSSLEHAAVIESLKACGGSITSLDPLPGTGSVTPSQIKAAIKDKTQMIVLSAANNETGITIDIEAISQIAIDAGIPFFVDGVAFLGKDTFRLPMGVAGMCFSGHKIHAPLGIGAAIIRRSFKASPLILGGGQQRGLRSGTENLPAIVGFAKSLELLQKSGEKWNAHMLSLRDRLENGILNTICDVIIHGRNEQRVCNTSNIAFAGVDGETLLMLLDLAGLAASHGSACSTGTLQTSRVLLNMGVDPKIARSSLRFTLSRFNTEEEIDRGISIISDAVNHLRKLD